MKRTTIAAALLALGACSKSTPPEQTSPSAKPAATTPVASAKPTATSKAPPTLAGGKLERAAEFDGDCEGKKAYTGDSLARHAEAKGCDGPLLVDHSTVDPKSGKVVDGETPIVCCP